MSTSSLLGRGFLVGVRESRRRERERERGKGFSPHSAEQRDECERLRDRMGRMSWIRVFTRCKSGGELRNCLDEKPDGSVKIWREGGRIDECERSAVVLMSLTLSSLFSLAFFATGSTKPKIAS